MQNEAIEVGKYDCINHVTDNALTEHSTTGNGAIHD